VRRIKFKCICIEKKFPRSTKTLIIPKDTTEYIYHMTRCMLRWLRRHVVNPCNTMLRIRICNGPEHAIILLLIEGFLLCAFLAIYDYAPEADASNRLNSVQPYLNGQSNSLPVTYTRKFYIGVVISY